MIAALEALRHPNSTLLKLLLQLPLHQYWCTFHHPV